MDGLEKVVGAGSSAQQLCHALPFQVFSTAPKPFSLRRLEVRQDLFKGRAGHNLDG